MTKKTDTDQAADTGAQKPALDRRAFLGGMALGTGAAALLGGLGGSNRALAAEGPPAGFGAPPAPTGPAISQPPPLAEVAGKVAYITGGNTGIGLGIARALSAAGMKVVLGYIDEKQVEPALSFFKPGNAGVIAIRHDVTDRDGWQRLLAEIKTKFGKLHLLVNNAGIKTLRKASEASATEWDLATGVNFTGIYNGVAACLPHFREHNEGAHIVTTASMGGLLPGAQAGVYTATKFGAVGLMEALRIELEKTNVGTSVFCPGGVNTDNRPAEIQAAEAAAAAEAAKREGRPVRPRFGGMDPLEAGERVLNGVRNNDLYILSHPEFKPGMQERFDAILASAVSDTPPPPSRVAAERVVLTTPIYVPEIAHRKQPRKSYRG